jgi:hypothetical protein
MCLVDKRRIEFLDAHKHAPGFFVPPGVDEAFERLVFVEIERCVLGHGDAGQEQQVQQD